MDVTATLKTLLFSIFLFWSLYNLPVFLVGLKRYVKTWRHETPLDPPDSYYPKISIIVPAKNEAKVIERLLKALVNLTYPEKEVIIVEDGSTDGTSEICKQHAEKHPSLVKYYHRDVSDGKPSAY